MKKIFFTAIMMIVVTINYAKINTLIEPFFAEQSLDQADDDDGWIVIGNATASSAFASDIIILKLCVREIGNRLFFRVEYQGDYYAASRGDSPWGEKKYYVTINDCKYWFDVPAESAGEENDNQEPDKYVGKWTFSPRSDWYVDISLINGRYNYSLNPDIISDIVEIQETSDGIVYTYYREYDLSPELNSKGWKYFYDDRDNNADSGFPTTGRYEYDSKTVFYTESITLSDDVPIHKSIKWHRYFFKGSKLTYADTDTDFSLPVYKSKLIRF